MQCTTSNAIGYAAAHKRVQKARGPASAHRCAHCSWPAADWAYDHEDPRALIGTTGGMPAAYSLDINHYRPLCKPCHTRFDQAVDPVCPAGHERTPANTYIDARGWRSCRACRRERRRAANADRDQLCFTFESA